MGVSSYIELFTTINGWYLYNVLWDVLSATGLVFVPFVVILVTTVYQGVEEEGYEYSAPSVLRVLEMRIVVALMVVMVALSPASFTAVSPGTLHYTPRQTITNYTTATAAAPTPTSASSNSGSLPNLIGTGSSTVPIPPLWWLVMSVSQGVTDASSAGMTRMPDFRGFYAIASSAKIQDPTLKELLDRFNTECFLPAKSEFFRNPPTGTSGFVATTTPPTWPAPATPQSIAQWEYNTMQWVYQVWGQADPFWVGSSLFQKMTGTNYYRLLQAKAPVPGFEYVAARDAGYVPAPPAVSTGLPPTWGQPYCYEWWTGLQANGGAVPMTSGWGYLGVTPDLKTQLLRYGQDVQDVTTALNNWLAAVGSTGAAYNDPAYTATQYFTLHTLLTNSPPSGDTNRYSQYGDGTLGHMATSLTTAPILGILSAIFLVTMELVTWFLPYIQAFSLFGVYIAIPIIMVMAGYSVGPVVAIATIIFALKLLTFWWDVAYWVDANMFMYLYPNTMAYLSSFVSLTSHSALDGAVSNIMGLVLYLVLPSVFFSLMSMAGIHAGHAANGIVDKLSSQPLSLTRNPLKRVLTRPRDEKSKKS